MACARPIAILALAWIATLSVADAEEALFIDPKGTTEKDSATLISQTLDRHREITRDEFFVRLSGSGNDPKTKTARGGADYWMAKNPPGIPNQQNGAILWVNIDKKDAYIRIGYGWDSAIQEKTANEIVKRQLVPYIGTPRFEPALAVVVQEILVEIQSPLALSGELGQVLGPLLQKMNPEDPSNSASVVWAWLALVFGTLALGLASYQFIAKELICDSQGWKPAPLRLVYADFDPRKFRANRQERGSGGF